MAHDPASDAAPITMAVRNTVGSGKSSDARAATVVALRALIAKEDRRAIVFAVPRHSLSDEAVEMFNNLPEARAAGLFGAVFRGRDARNPASSDNPQDRMCADIIRVKDAMKARRSIQKAVCKHKKKTCPLFNSCAYQAQSRRNDTPNVWFVAHEMLFHEKPAVIGKIAALIVDESMFAAGLDNSRLSLNDFEVDLPISIPGIDGGQRFDYLRAAARKGLSADGPVMRKAMADATLTTESAGEAYTLAWSGKVDPGMHPGMTPAQREEAIAKAEINAIVALVAMFWNAMKALLAPDGSEASGWASVGWLKSKRDGLVRTIFLKHRKSIREGWITPTLLLDANLDLSLVKPYWPNVTLAADINIEALHQRIFQLAERTYSKRYFNLGDDDEPDDDTPLPLADQKKRDQQRADGNRHLRRLHSTVATIARRYAPQRTLLVVQLGVEKALPAFGPMPATIDIAHHNNIAGLDEWKDVACLIVVGRTQPPPFTVERDAEALTGRAVTPIAGWYPKVAAARLLDNGDTVSAERDCHPDPVAEAIRWQACEGELVQIIGRGRGINRTAANPLDVFVLGNTVLPMPVTKLLSADDIDPTRRNA